MQEVCYWKNTYESQVDDDYIIDFIFPGQPDRVWPKSTACSRAWQHASLPTKVTNQSADCDGA
jgi:hypothetical protein